MSMILIRINYLMLLMLLYISVTPTTATPVPHDQIVTSNNDLTRIYGRDISAAIFSAVSEQNYLDLIIKLTENGSRPVDSENNRLARSWIIQQLEHVTQGRIEIQVLGPHKSVVGRLPGYLGQGPIVMVGGHYDTVPAAPGANDDATGVAATIELARVMSAFSWPLDIYFCTWNAEEIGLVGSHEVAKIFDEWNIEILAYYNIDMLLVEDTDAPRDERVLLGYSGAAMNYAIVTDHMSQIYGKNLIKSLEGPEMNVWGRSDHASFLSEGFSSVMFAFESGLYRDTAYHTSSDTWDNSLYNYTVAIDAVASIGASMAITQARAHDEPTSKSFTGRLRGDQPSTTSIPITTTTGVEIKGSWIGGGFTAEVISPQGLVVQAFDIDDTNGSGVIGNYSAEGRGVYSISLSGHEGSDTCYSFEVLYDTDLNLDGIQDRHQFWLDPSEFQKDDDGDSLSNGLETIIGTSPASSDSDSDYLPDLWEYTYGTDATRADADEDPDGDYLDNAAEYEAGTHPLLRDSDGDLIIDSWEVVNGTDALIDDADQDPDGDTLTNYEEYVLGTLPLSNDSDSDQMPDGFEVAYAFDPKRNDAGLDGDGDGLSNLEEYLLGTNPRNSDSDSDLMPDSFEILYGLNPWVNDAMDDPDLDGVSNLEEYLRGTNPRIDSLLQVLTLSTAAILGIFLSLWILAFTRYRK